jgi:hypothetical protein
MDSIRFDVYGRFEVVVTRTPSGWRVVRSGAAGKRSLDGEFLEPHVTEAGLADRLEILFHESGRPGARIRRIP